MDQNKALPLTELTVRMESVSDLLQPPPPELIHRLGRIDSGIQELLLQLDAGRLPPRLRTTFILVATAPPLGAEELESVLREYCRLRLRNVELRLRGHRREGIRLMGIGIVLFLLGVFLSAEFLRAYWPPMVQELLGDGVFLVLAWVGLWYPLDHLIFAHRAIVRERDLLRAVWDMDVVLRQVSETDLEPDSTSARSWP